MATSSTSWAWQKAASAAMPAGVLGKDAEAPLRPMRAARDTDAISTPQITWVTVTFLVSAIESLATVRSCVTGAAVPGLSDGELPPQDEREPSARGGTDASVPPLQQLLPFTVAVSRDTRMTGCWGNCLFFALIFGQPVDLPRAILVLRRERRQVIAHQVEAIVLRTWPIHEAD